LRHKYILFQPRLILPIFHQTIIHTTYHPHFGHLTLVDHRFISYSRLFSSALPLSSRLAVVHELLSIRPVVRQPCSATMSSPDGKSPGDNVPGENVPGDSVPEDQTPGDNAPEGNVTGTTVPGDIATGDNALGVYMPTDNILTSIGDQVAGDVISTLEDTVPEDNVIEENMTSPNAISSTDLSWLCASGPSTSPTTTDYGATRLQHSIGRCHKQMDQARSSYQLYLRLHDVLRFGLHFLAGEFGTLEAQLIKIKIQHDVTQNAVKEVCDSISGSIKDMPPMDRKEVPFPFLQHPAKREQLNFIKLLLAALSGTGAHNDSNIRNNLHTAATIFNFHERTEEITYLGGLCRNLETSDQQYMREEIRKLKPSVSRIASDVFPDLAADVWDSAVERIDKFIDHTKPLIEGLGSEVARMREIMHLAGYETVAVSGNRDLMKSLTDSIWIGSSLEESQHTQRQARPSSGNRQQRPLGRDH
jgi:hypothetical protein